MATLKLNAMKYVFDKVDVAPCFILFYQLRQKTNKQTNKQTDKQKERWQGHCNSCGQLQRAGILKKKIKTRNIKKHSDTRKTTATYNKLLDETRDEHYYILNRQT